jgi:hypothetical protein
MPGPRRRSSGSGYKADDQYRVIFGADGLSVKVEHMEDGTTTCCTLEIQVPGPTQDEMIAVLMTANFEIEKRHGRR